jgi:archaellum biogenesis ATPase FlaH
MVSTIKTRAYSILAVLVLCLGGISCQKPQEKTGPEGQQAVKTSETEMTTAEIIQRMQDLSAEISRAMEKMKKNAAAKDSGSEDTITLSRNQMTFMCENMQSMIDNMVRLITDLDTMASKEKPLTNEDYRAYAERMLASMKTCVEHAEALWEGQ